MMGIFLRTFFVFFYAVVTVSVTTVLGLLVAILSIFGLRKFVRVLVYRLAQLWAIGVVKIIGCPVTVTGREHIPRKGGVCLVSNHGSIFDIVLLLAYAGRPIGFIAKKELVWLPFFNLWISLLGGLFIDRKNVRKAIRTINKGVARIRDGGGMIIFPEGHRSRGQGLLPFHAGSLKLASLAETTVIPVALSGTYDAFEIDYRAHIVPVTVTFCKPINTAEIPKTDRKMVLCNQVYGVIKETLESN